MASNSTRDREQVIARAREAGVETMVAIGNGDGPPTLDCGIRLAEKHPVHVRDHRASIPTKRGWRPSRLTPTWSELARHPKVIAWGEIGLDYYYDHSPRDVQQQVFIRQMELARDAKLPIVIHCRPSDNSENAWDDCLALDPANIGLPADLGGILHCFTGNWAHAKRALDMGFMISFAGNMTFPKAQQIRDAAQAGSAGPHADRNGLALIWRRCLIAASATSRRSSRKRRANWAKLRGLSAEEIGEQTAQNFYSFLFASRKALAPFSLLCASSLEGQVNLIQIN